MSEQRLRALERRLAEGDRAARAALLRERLRIGLLAGERLSLAAYLGDAAAQEALGEQAPHCPAGLESWMRGLRPWGRPAWLRAAIAAARQVLPLWEAGHPAELRPRAAIEAAEASLGDASPDRREAAHGAALAAYEVLSELEAALRPPDTTTTEDLAVRAQLAVAFCETRAATQVALAAAERKGRGLGSAVLAAVAARERLALDEAPPGPGRTSLLLRVSYSDRLGQLPELNTPSSIAAVRAAIAAALLPWALSKELL